ncbi:MAG: hypothetical protein WCX48_11125 [Bacteroidales bacterium]
MLAVDRGSKGNGKGERSKKLIDGVETIFLESSSKKTLDDGTVLTRCDQCREMWKDRNARGVDGDPPCDDCRVELLKENHDAVRVFFLTQNQLIMGPSGPIDINQLAVHAAIDLYGIKDRQGCFDKVMRLSRWHLDRIMAKD